MSHSIKPGLVPPERGLEKEEPEQWQEDDLPSDDGTTTTRSPGGEAGREERPRREIERE